MTLLRYVRADGRRVPAEYETVEVDPDGRLAGWRSVAVGAVGSFEGAIADDEVDDLRALVERAQAAPAPGAIRRPGAASETLELGDGSAVEVAGLDPADDPAWSELVARGRDLLERQGAFPVAAIGLDAERGRLELLGTHRLELDLSDAVVTRYGWMPDGALAGEASAPLDAGGRVRAEPGWSLELPPAGEGLPSDAAVQTVVRFAIVAAGTSVAVEVATEPPD
ncbi:hypothetical protein GCM10017608_25020 [Agromyces luteolus]|uniref:Uncharacterized protein n=1 Tax=Agromyces luteolus TaxID=88373 RepID=A0A7C9LDS0_9MICO|nr:hypothetical protein [Agromyces luteolus]MUN07311.1 hypothetical protein [Agromyces luteolus]GLK28568.1 hypothetical protein GCM10017608_25020 [Agromyces luteolus]